MLEIRSMKTNDGRSMVNLLLVLVSVGGLIPGLALIYSMAAVEGLCTCKGWHEWIDRSDR